MSRGHKTHSAILWTVYTKKNLILFLTYYTHWKERVEDIYIDDFSQRKRELSTYLGVKITVRELRIQLTWIIAVVITDITPRDSNNLWWQIWGLLLVVYGLCVHLSEGPFVICFTQVHFIPDLLLLGLLPLLLLLIFFKLRYKVTMTDSNALYLETRWC